ncbi:MAG: 2Fe-2S iron-sulfur cluster-binding protein [Planctomycetota bacterium]|jgi:ferredoxin-NADP reductase
MSAAIAQFAWIAGAVIVGLVVLQGLMALVGSIRRGHHERAREQLELAVLREKVGAARIERKQREAAAQAWAGERKFEVKRKVDEGGDICSFYLTPHDGKQLAGFQPGQYLTFSVPVSGQNRPVVRCYSLSDAPHEDYYRVSIKKIPPPRDAPDAPPGLISSHFHEQVNEGDILDVRAPNGHFHLDLARDTPVVLIGGGIGITPVLSMLNGIIATEASRECWFFYGVRHGGEHIMREHLDEIVAEHENVHLHVCYSEPRDDDQVGVHYQHKGWVGVDLFKQLLPSSNYDYYICGPPPMMETITRDLEAWGVPTDAVHFEAFGPATVKKTKPHHAEAAPDAATAFEISFARSGKVVAWDPACESLLEFAEANDIAIDAGCRAGNCGTCITAIKSGDIDYTTEPGADCEAGSCLTCVCTPKGPLTLDA